jgi:hypothetical protein
MSGVPLLLSSLSNLTNLVCHITDKQHASMSSIMNLLQQITMLIITGYIEKALIIKCQAASFSKYGMVKAFCLKIIQYPSKHVT